MISNAHFRHAQMHSIPDLNLGLYLYSFSPFTFSNHLGKWPTQEGRRRVYLFSLSLSQHHRHSSGRASSSMAKLTWRGSRAVRGMDLLTLWVHGNWAGDRNDYALYGRYVRDQNFARVNVLMLSHGWHGWYDTDTTANLWKSRKLYNFFVRGIVIVVDILFLGVLTDWLWLGHQ